MRQTIYPHRSGFDIDLARRRDTMRPIAALVTMSAAMLLQGLAARADLIATFDENGNGKSLYTVTGETATLPGTNDVDPFDPGNGLKPLVYDLKTPTAMVN